MLAFRSCKEELYHDDWFYPSVVVQNWQVRKWQLSIGINIWWRLNISVFCACSDWLPLHAATRVLVHFILPESATVEAHALISHTGTPAQVTCCSGLYFAYISRLVPANSKYRVVPLKVSFPFIHNLLMCLTNSLSFQVVFKAQSFIPVSLIRLAQLWHSW